MQRLGGQLLAIDPIWSTRIHTVPRRSPPGVAFEAVPKLDVVTVSHAHYDHLDLPTLERIGKDALYIVPRDNADVLTSVGLRNVVELGWWESHQVGDVQITLVPAQHWGRLTDGRVTCWGLNTSGQLGIGSTVSSSVPKAVSGITTATKLVCGYNHACAIENTGRVKCWSDNAYGRVGNGTLPTDATTPQIATF